MIKVQVIGNVGQDARVNEVNGRKAVNFSVCHNQKRTDKDGVVTEHQVWVNSTYWREGNQSVEVAKYLKKGTKVFVEGYPDVEIYKDKEGRPACALNVRVSNIELLQVKEPDQDTGNDADKFYENRAANAAPVPSGDESDDLPF